MFFPDAAHRRLEKQEGNDHHGQFEHSDDALVDSEPLHGLNNYSGGHQATFVIPLLFRTVMAYSPRAVETGAGSVSH